MVDYSWKSLALAAALVSLGGSAIAANRCVDAKGKVTYQDAACSKDTENTKRVDTSEGFSTGPVPGASPRATAGQEPLTQTSGSSDYATFRGA